MIKAAEDAYEFNYENPNAMEAAICAADDARGIRIEERRAIHASRYAGPGANLIDCARTKIARRYISDWHPVERDEQNIDRKERR